jgi:hypothetical protein
MKNLHWLFLPMEGFDHLSLIVDGLVEDLELSITPEQLCHHEAAQALVANPPLEGVEKRIWARWRRNELFHIEDIHRLGLVAQAQGGSSLPPTPVEHPAPPIIMDTGKPVPT